MLSSFEDPDHQPPRAALNFVHRWLSNPTWTAAGGIATYLAASKLGIDSPAEIASGVAAAGWGTFAMLGSAPRTALELIRGHQTSLSFDDIAAGKKLGLSGQQVADALRAGAADNAYFKALDDQSKTRNAAQAAETLANNNPTPDNLDAKAKTQAAAQAADDRAAQASARRPDPQSVEMGRLGALREQKRIMGEGAALDSDRADINKDQDALSAERRALDARQKGLTGEQPLGVAEARAQSDDFAARQRDLDTRRADLDTKTANLGADQRALDADALSARRNPRPAWGDGLAGGGVRSLDAWDRPAKDAGVVRKALTPQGLTAIGLTIGAFGDLAATLTASSSKAVPNVQLPKPGQKVTPPHVQTKPPKTPKPTLHQRVVTPIDGVNERKSASPTAPIIGVLREGSFVETTGRQRTSDGVSFDQVQLADGKDAWIAGAYLGAAPPSGALNSSGGRYDPKLARAGLRAVVVRPGDTIWGIAAFHDVSPSATIALNKGHIEDPNLIFPGDVIYLPTTAAQRPALTFPPNIRRYSSA
jgi:hypothetical protein